MVLNFYNLTQAPFGTTPNPEFLYLGKSHREALAAVAHGLSAGRGFTALIAAPGMGKTTLLWMLLQQLKPTTRTAFVAHAQCSPRELLLGLLASLEVRDTGDSFLEMHKKLNDVLLREHNSQKRFVVVMDEAQSLAESTLELLRVLSNVETSREKLIHFVLAGQPYFAERLASPQLIHLRQRFSIFARLEPFDSEETRSYIDHRLRVAGYDFARPMFAPPALELIARKTHGIPRNINNVCFNALALGYVRSQRTIGADIVEEVLRDLDVGLLIETRDTNFEPPKVAASQVQDVDLRRSSRVQKAIPLTVAGTNRAGLPFEEQCSVLSLNLHGCRYASSQDNPVGSWVTLKINPPTSEDLQSVRARICSVHSAHSSLEASQVGVELENPANIWGLSAPPSDWHEILRSQNVGAADSDSLARSLQEEIASPGDHSTAASAGTDPYKPPLTLTVEQLVPLFQESLEQTARRVAQSAVESRLNEAIDEALRRIDEFWDANANKAQKLSAERLAHLQEQWDKELAAFHNGAELSAKRMETLGARAAHGLIELQKLITHVKEETELRLKAGHRESLAEMLQEVRATSAQLTQEHSVQVDRAIESAIQRAQLDLQQIVAQSRDQASENFRACEERAGSQIESMHSSLCRYVDSSLADLRVHLERQLESIRAGAEQASRDAEGAVQELRKMAVGHQEELAGIRSQLAESAGAVPRQAFESQMQLQAERLRSHVEGLNQRLVEFTSHSDRQLALAQQNAAELAHRLDDLALAHRELASKHHENVDDLRASLALADVRSGERVEGIVALVREQYFDQLKTRLDEIERDAVQRQNAAAQHREDISRRMDEFRTESKAAFQEMRDSVDRLPKETSAQNLEAIEKSTDGALKALSSSAVRISDREISRIREEKQAIGRELSLELDAHVAASHVSIEKLSNTTLDDFRRRLESQSELLIADATETIASAIAARDAEYRTAVEAHHQALQAEVARAAERSATEFHTGMKAFLYSCLVAAVSAVDQHAQTTLGGLSQTAKNLTVRSGPDKTASQSEDAWPPAPEQRG